MSGIKSCLQAGLFIGCDLRTSGWAADRSTVGVGDASLGLCTMSYGLNRIQLMLVLLLLAKVHYAT